MFNEQELQLILMLADRVAVSGRDSRMQLAALENKCGEELRKLANPDAEAKKE